jgi:arsenite/tail-anchored protein-transporting ATPase
VIPASFPTASAKLHRVALVTGKGGVGKTTVAVGLAAGAVARGESAVLVEFGDGEAGRRALGRHGRGVEHVVIDPLDAVVRFGGEVFGSTLLARAVLGNFAVKRFVRAAPAIRELAMLECVRMIAADHRKASVIVDLPATGHGVAWLRVPAQLRGVLASGPAVEVVDRLCRELIAPGRASIVVVTLPERLVLRETLELWQAIRRDVGIPPARLVINRFPRALPAEALADAERLAARGDDLGAAASELVGALVARETARSEALESLAEALVSTALPAVILPEAQADPRCDEVAAWLRAEHFS